MSLKHQRVTRNGAHLDAKVINPDSLDRRKADVRVSVVFCQLENITVYWLSVLFLAAFLDI